MLETLVRTLHMVRLTAGVVAMLALVGCLGNIDDGDNGGLSEAQAIARQAWTDKALPQLQTNCMSCHDGTRANIGFLEGADPIAKRDDLVAFEPNVVNLTAPQSSRLLTKGLHEGPALIASQASDILEWLQAEKDAQNEPDPTAPKLETSQFLPLICTSGLPGEPTCPINTVPLDEIGVVGGSISFVAQALGSGLYVNNLKLVPGPMGAFIEHPLFVSWPAEAEPLPDTIDRFFSVKMNLMPTATPEEQQIAGGTAAFVGFVATDKLTIHFKAVNMFVPDDPGPGPGPGVTGCKDLASFKANARGPINTNCGSCHANAGNANAVSAMGLVGLNSADDAVVQTACNQVLIRTNLTTLDQSGIYLAPDPANNNHPFRFPTAAAHTAFKTAVNVWANAEKVAP